MLWVKNDNQSNAVGSVDDYKKLAKYHRNNMRSSDY